MANAEKMLGSTPFRGMIVGFPGAGKTGALVPLITAGFKIRMLNYDGNEQPLFAYADPTMLKNVDIVRLEDKMKVTPQYVGPDGIPTAFLDGLKLMNHWTYKEDDGTVVDLGHSADWGLDTVVVLDSMQSMGDSAKNRAMVIRNKTPLNTTDGVWGLGMNEQDEFIKVLAKNKARHHTIILSHLKIIQPRDKRQGDSQMTEDIKEQLAELIKARYYPAALGWALPQQIARHVPIVLEAKKKFVGRAVHRILSPVPREELDLKLPIKDLQPEYPLETGLLDIFRKVSPEAVALVESQRGGR